MEYLYALTIAYDGKAPHSVSRYSDCISAVNDWNKCVDFGDAENFATYNLAEPNGKLHTKHFYRNGVVNGK
jgi:hypothetical protein